MKSIFRLFLFTTVLVTTGIFTATTLAAEGANFSLQVVSSEVAPQAGSYYVFDGQPGTIIQGEIRVVNDGAAAGAVRLYAVDAVTGQTGGTVFPLHDDVRQAAGDWVILGADEFTLGAGESQIVPLTITVPAGVRAGHHVAGIVAEPIELDDVVDANAGAGAANFQVKIQNRTAMAVQINLPGTAVEQVDVIAITAGGQQGHQALLISMRNSGTLMLKPAGTLIVTNAAGEKLQSLEFTLDTFLPETEIHYPVYVKSEALPPGEYEAELTLEYGEGQETSHQLGFTITETQLAQVFESRQALSAPEMATVNDVAGGVVRYWRPLILGGLGTLDGALALVLVALVYSTYRRKQALPPH